MRLRPASLKQQAKNVGAAEREAAEALARVARENGPLYAAHLVSRGELSGPVTRFLYSRLPLGPLSSPWRLRATVLAAGPFFVWWVLSLVDHAIVTWGTVAQIAVAAVFAALGLAAGTAIYVLALSSTRTSLWSRIAGWSHEDLLYWGVLVFLLPTLAFAAVTALLVHEDLLGTQGYEADDLAFRTFETFAWSLVDAIPIVKAPETLNWEPGMKLTSVTGGALLLAYKLILVLPLVQLIALGLQRLFGATPDAEPPNPVEALEPPAGATVVTQG